VLSNHFCFKQSEQRLISIFIHAAYRRRIEGVVFNAALNSFAVLLCVLIVNAQQVLSSNLLKL